MNKNTIGLNPMYNVIAYSHIDVPVCPRSNAPFHTVTVEMWSRSSHGACDLPMHPAELPQALTPPVSTAHVE